jgi:uncharacterized sulfatase
MGQWATRTGCVTNGIALPLDADTIANRMNAAGYETGYVGKWHLASQHENKLRDRPGQDKPINLRTEPVPPERRGGYKDYWVASDVLEFTSHGYGGYMYDADGNKLEWDEDTYRVDACTDYVVDFLETREGEKPWFLFVSYIEPHHQNDRHRYEGPHGSKERWKDYKVPGDLVDTEGDWRENYPDYLGQVNSLDQNLGRIRDTLERLGMSDNTLIIYTSDHGSHFCTRNSEYKRACHDNCTHIPMVLQGPGFRGGRRVNELVSLIDLPVTILNAAGLESPQTMDGAPLQPFGAGEPADWKDEVFIQISEATCSRAIRTQKWKYSVIALNADGNVANEDTVYVENYLYDLDADPHERNNLVREPELADLRAELAQRLKARMADAGEAVPEIQPAG